MSTRKIKVGDKVRVIAGKDKGVEGNVIKIDRKRNRLTVEGVNIVTKHNKQSPANVNGGITSFEAPIDASNVMLLVGGRVTRVGFAFKDGKKVRIAKVDGSVIG